MSTTSFRSEHDLLGSLPVPKDAYYGIQTLRAMHNFNLSGVPLSHYPDFVSALAMVKQRSEEHTSELQSRPHLVCRLLLEKKKIPNDLRRGNPYISDPPPRRYIQAP